MYFFNDIPYTKFAWELNLFHKYRDFSDGISFIEFNINYDKYICDHNPKFEMMFCIFNYMLFEFSIYNIYHVKNDKYNI
jgi:hypothetical protein